MRRMIICIGLAFAAAMLLTACGTRGNSKADSKPQARANTLSANRASPFIAIDCSTANSFACDRVYFFFAMKRPATALQAWVADRPVTDLRTDRLAPGSGRRTGKSGYAWSGIVRPAGMTEPGAPLEIKTSDGSDHWVGNPPVSADIRITAKLRNGRKITQVYRHVPLRAGHG